MLEKRKKSSQTKPRFFCSCLHHHLSLHTFLKENHTNRKKERKKERKKASGGSFVLRVYSEGDKLALDE